MTDRNAGNARQHYQSIEGLRALCMIFVFGVHLYQNLHPYATTSVARGLEELGKALGFIAVEAFFLMTGVFTYKGLLASGSGSSLGTFLKRRAVRLLPAYWATLAIFFFVYLRWPYLTSNPLPPEPAAKAMELFTNILVLGAFRTEPPINRVSWVLGYFIAFYIAAGMLVYWFRLAGRSKAIRTAVSIALLVLIALLDQLVSWWPLESAMLPVGMLVADSLDSPALSRLTERALWLWTLTGLTAKLALKWTLPLESILPVQIYSEFVASAVFCTGLLLLTIRTGGAFSTIMESRPLQWLGGRSYSFYLTHVLAIKFVLNVVVQPMGLAAHPQAVFWLGQPVSFLLALLIGHGMFVLVEQPVAAVFQRRP